MIAPSTRVHRSERAVYRDLASGGGVLLHLDTAAYHGVNDVGALIWTLIDGSALEEVVERLAKELVDPPATLADDVAEFLDALAARDLVRVGVRGDR